MTIVLILIHWLHILAAAAWLGTSITTLFVVIPSLLKRPPAESHAAFQLIAARMQRVMPVLGQLTFWLGLLRGTWLGSVRSFGILFGTPYGHAFLGALILTIVIIVHGATTGTRIERRVWDGDRYRPDAAAYVRNAGITSLVLFGLVLACMVMMRFGV